MLDDISVRNNSGAHATGALRSLLGAVALVLGSCFVGHAQEGVKVQPSAAERNAPPSVTRTTSSEFVRPRRSTTQTATPAGNSLTPTAATSDNSSSPESAEFDELRAQIKEAKSEGERASVRRALVERLVKAGRQREAVGELRAMTREERFDPAGFYNIGNALARLGESHAAVEAYRKAIQQRHGNYSRAQHNLGVVLIRLGRWDEAHEALSAALRLESFNYTEASYNMGRLYALRGEAGLAIREWQRTLTLEPDHADAAVALARAYAEDGDPRQGLAVLDSLIARSHRAGGSPPRAVVIARGEILAASNVVANARRGDTETVPAKASGASGGGHVERRSEARATRAAAALPVLRPLAVDQGTYDLLQRARAARESGRNEEAVSFYRRVLARRGNYFPPANLELGYALTSLQRTEEAVTSLLPVASTEGDRYPIVYYHLGRLYERLGQLSRAGENFGRAAALLGDANPQVLLDVSRVREKEGNVTAALAAMEAYVRASKRLGSTPEWANERIAELRQKVAAVNIKNPAPPRP